MTETHTHTQSTLTDKAPKRLTHSVSHTFHFDVSKATIESKKSINTKNYSFRWWFVSLERTSHSITHHHQYNESAVTAAATTTTTTNTSSKFHNDILHISYHTDDILSSFVVNGKTNFLHKRMRFVLRLLGSSFLSANGNREWKYWNLNTNASKIWKF